MKVKERREVQIVLKDAIKLIESRLDEANYLCLMDSHKCLLKLDNEELPIKCGYNDRMLPNTLDYITSERPTKIRNKDFYNGLGFYKKIEHANDPWWIYAQGNDVFISVNMEKIRFLKHLIKKLK